VALSDRYLLSRLLSLASQKSRSLRAAEAGNDITAPGKADLRAPDSVNGYS